jgi:Lanthionine synthetase C-like protein
MLFSTAAHEPLTDTPWSAERARGAIRGIVDDAEQAFDDGWPVHPLDDDVEGTPRKPRTLYLGGAGVVAALHRLGSSRDWAPYLERSITEPDLPDEDAERSLLTGEVGVRLVLQRVAPSGQNLERVADLIAANAQDERCELLWGSPGTILAGRELGLDVTPSVEWLRAQRDEDGLWTQRLHGHVHRYLGPAHGFAGCALALGDLSDVTQTLERFAVHEDGLVNWPPIAETKLEAQRDGLIRVQWCHGSPGMVATLAPFMAEELAVAGGELTWRAGPLRKGPSLCHGTAGNGYAFLALFARTGDELWLERARVFAMHAAQQVETARREYARGRYSLWTGDLGVALYLADCVDGVGKLPLP